jgi:hypothetical protein
MMGVLAMSLEGSRGISTIAKPVRLRWPISHRRQPHSSSNRIETLFWELRDLAECARALKMERRRGPCVAALVDCTKCAQTERLAALSQKAKLDDATIADCWPVGDSLKGFPFDNVQR